MKKITICSLLFLLSLMVFGQPSCTIKTFKELNEKSLRISRILMDKDGFMWFATLNGLYRFDGYQFDAFKSRPGDGSEMMSNHIKAIYESPEHGIWCLAGKSVFLFDMATYKFINVLHLLEKKHKRTFEVDKMRCMQNGTTWLICEDHTYICLQDKNPQETAAIRLRLPDEDNQSIQTDKEGRSWILTDKSTYLIEGAKVHNLRFHTKLAVNLNNSEKTLLFLKDDGKVYTYTHGRVTGLPVLPDAPIQKMRALKNGLLALWANSHLYIYNVAMHNLRDLGSIEDDQYCYEDRKGGLWLQTKDLRLVCINLNSGLRTQIIGVSDKLNMIHEDDENTVWMMTEDGQLCYLSPGSSVATPFSTLHDDMKDGMNLITDSQGDVWFHNDSEVFMLSFGHQLYQNFPLPHPSQIRCGFIDSKQRLWIGGKDDKTVMLYDRHNTLLGYLGPDGGIHSGPISFGSAVYCVTEDHAGQIWLGTKPDGLYRLRPAGNGSFEVDHFLPDPHNKFSISAANVYALCEDRQGRLWIGTYGGGINCIDNVEVKHPRFAHSGNILKGYHSDFAKNINYLLITHDSHLLMSTDDGLYIADIRTKNLRNVVFRQHRREADSEQCISSNAVRASLEDSQHRVFVCTEDGGINEIVSKNLDADKLIFKHYDSTNGFPSDVAQAIFEDKGRLWVTTRNALIEFDTHHQNQTAYNVFFRQEDFFFSEAHPTRLPSGQWLFGTMDGGILVRLPQLKAEHSLPQIALASLQVQDKPALYNINHLDKITLQPDERTLTVRFTALDYGNADNIEYAYRMGDGKHQNWTFLGKDHTLNFINLAPGTYHIEIKSTNGDGIWMSNTKAFVLYVRPTFWETPWALLLLLLLIGAGVYGIVYTYGYIKRINEQRKETLNKYLELLNTSNQQNPNLASTVQPMSDNKPAQNNQADRLSESDKKFMGEIISFTEKHLPDSDISIDDMAEHVAVSRSGLNRKLKQLTGISPGEFIKEARIKHACQLLSQSEKTINEIAFECGFADPKYFSRVFKATTNMTPTEYRNA
ncbi:MAG: two-component regulator propeller domain-containing protein [Prevotella sp.]|nr:two-component regulator propeller domain-containing protein [Prevotella sp.]MDY5258634.1 two-component regulator propeller domain-containing protein [Prevotella sp.]